MIPEGGAEALAFGDGALWVGGGVIGRLSRIDPRTNEVTTPTRDLGSWLCCVAVGGGYVWAVVTPADRVWKISEEGQLVSSLKIGAKVENLTYADGAVWVVDRRCGHGRQDRSDHGRDEVVQARTPRSRRGRSATVSSRSACRGQGRT